MTTYKTTGINLKSTVLGENDRILTILTPEYGLIQAVSPGSRKHHSSLRGRSEIFIVNELLIAKGRSLDKITQAEIIKSYPGLSKNLTKLATSQYLAELILNYALKEHPQPELFDLLIEHLQHIEKSELTLPILCHGMFHILAIVGLSPQVQICCITQKPLQTDQEIGFSITAGGTVNISALRAYNQQQEKQSEPNPAESGLYEIENHPQELLKLTQKLTLLELTLLQQLPSPEILPSVLSPRDPEPWHKIEKILRQYVQYNLGKSIRCASLIDDCF